MGQAKADAQEVRKQIDKAVNELNAIKEELINLKDVNTDDLDKLGQFLRIIKFPLLLIYHFIKNFRKSLSCCRNGIRSR